MSIGTLNSPSSSAFGGNNGGMVWMRPARRPKHARRARYSRGVIAEVKHFTAHSHETGRRLPSDDSIVSTRTLHEIYLPPF
jgi:hypothetical protein